MDANTKKYAKRLKKGHIKVTHKRFGIHVEISYQNAYYRSHIVEYYEIMKMCSKLIMCN